MHPTRHPIPSLITKTEEGQLQGSLHQAATYLEALSETMESSRLITLMVLMVALAASKKVVVKYFGEDYLVDGGCRAKDETVLR